MYGEDALHGPWNKRGTSCAPPSVADGGGYREHRGKGVSQAAKTTRAPPLGTANETLPNPRPALRSHRTCTHPHRRYSCERDYPPPSRTPRRCPPRSAVPRRQMELTVTGASTRCTLLSSTRISRALAQSDFTSDSLRYSHRRSCSICRSRSVVGEA